MRRIITRGGRVAIAIKGYVDRPWFYPTILLLLGLLAYVYALPSLGYYWDDWEVVFLLNARDPALLSGYFAFDRPFAWPYQAMYALFSLNPVAWHLVTLLLRLAGILLLYQSLSLIWPSQRSYLRWLGALMLVYPGYLQQSISAAYNRHFTAFFVFALSIYFMALAVRGRDQLRALHPIAWLLTFVHVFTIEYFVGLELIRPFLLWLLVAQDTSPGRRGTAARVFLLALPYLLILGFYFWWRLIVFPGTIDISNYAGDFKFLQDFGTSIPAGLLAVLTRGVLDLIYSTVQVWLSVLGDPDAVTFQSKIAWFAFGMGAVIAAIFAFFHDATDDSRLETAGERRSLLLFGLWAFLVGGLPIWLTSKQLSTQGRWDDRFSLAPMLGAGILTIGLVAYFIQPRQRKLLLGVLLAFSITTQVLTVNRYRLDWSVQNSYYWQLAWRVPALAPGTAVISLEQPSPSIPGYDASFAMNILFDGKVADGMVPYWFFTNDRFLNFEFKPGKAISYKDRNLRFIGNTAEAIAVVHQGESRCLQVLDTVYAEQPFYASGQEQLVVVSNTSRILRNTYARKPPSSVFGPEPPHTWCYYFEKADLARQYLDWDAVLTLEKQARDAGHASKFGVEYIPFIEAHAHLGNWPEALRLSQTAQTSISEMEPLLCSTWERLSRLPSSDAATVQDARRHFSCPTP